jgi:hypothetical protein
VSPAAPNAVSAPVAGAHSASGTGVVGASSAGTGSTGEGAGSSVPAGGAQGPAAR